MNRPSISAKHQFASRHAGNHAGEHPAATSRQRQPENRSNPGRYFSVRPNANPARSLTTKPRTQPSPHSFSHRFPLFTAPQQAPASPTPRHILQPPEPEVVDYPELSFTEFNQTLESWPGESCAAQEAETVARAAGLRTLTRPEYLRMIEALSEPFEGAIPVAQQYPEIERSKFNKENLTTWLLTAQQQDPLFKKPAWALPTDREELYQFSEMLRHPPYVNLYDKTTLRDIFWAVKRVAFPEFINCWPAQYSEIEQKEMVAYADMCQNLQKAARLYFVSRTSISRWRNDLKACRAVSATRYAALL